MVSIDGGKIRETKEVDLIDILQKQKLVGSYLKMIADYRVVKHYVDPITETIQVTGRDSALRLTILVF